ncbi:hypothetical protein F2P44_18655 [Massilia sp. CCM 8695]|uniref:Uncharacterized protein n=1 Tax=Massilia frigida TaxID=2609281 RepID=A0ABX0NJ18_9BURK|nr:hypothetical protein [Massilia frigida]NHZ81280.1 hypothetical protein [Massilia frigida]
MTVALIVTRPDSEKWQWFTVPLAVEEVYQRYWMPGAAATAAVWLPLFQTGCPVEGKDFPALTMELLTLRGWVLAQPFDDGRQQALTGRIDALIDALGELLADTGGEVEVFIG